MSTLPILANSPAVHALGMSLLHFLWQGVLIAAALRLVLAFLAERSASARYAVSLGALLLLLATPAATFALLLPVSGLAGHEHGSMLAAGLASGAAPIAERVAPLAVLVWLAGASLLCLRFGRSLSAVTRLRREGCRELRGAERSQLDELRRRLGIGRAVRLAESSLARVPMVVGWLRPVILLPGCALTGLSQEQLKTILAHELAHIRRLDFLVNLFQAIVESLLFYHPAVWWVSKRMRVERELCCDDLAVAACGDALTYARALLELESSQDPVPQFVLGANGGSLMQRIQRLMDSDRRQIGTFSGWAPAGLLTAALLALTPVAAFAQDGKKDKLCPDCSAKLRGMMAEEEPGSQEVTDLLLNTTLDLQTLQGDQDTYVVQVDPMLQSGQRFYIYEGKLNPLSGVVVDLEGNPVESTSLFMVEPRIEKQELTLDPVILHWEVAEEGEKRLSIVELDLTEGAGQRLRFGQGDGQIEVSGRTINIYIQGRVELEVQGGEHDQVEIHRSHGESTEDGQTRQSWRWFDSEHGEHGRAAPFGNVWTQREGHKAATDPQLTGEWTQAWFTPMTHLRAWKWTENKVH